MTRLLARFRDVSIKNKLVFIILSVSSLALFLALALILTLSAAANKKRLERGMTAFSNLLGEYCVVPLSFDDRAEAGGVLSKTQSLPAVELAALYDGNGKLFAAFNPAHAALDSNFMDLSEGLSYSGITMHIRHAVVFQGNRLGTLLLSATTRPLRREIQFQAAVLTGIVALLMLMAYFLALRLQGLISRPILHLAEAAKRVSEGGDLSHRVAWDGKDEIGALYEGYNRMLDQLQAREREKAQTAEEARVRQQQLLQAGKMVTLGTLVSGVAHEINNPNAYIMLNSSMALKKWKEFTACSQDAESPKIGNGPPDAMYEHMLENILRGSQRIDGIVKRLKDYYRKDGAGEKDWISVNAVIEKAIEILGAKIRAYADNFRFLPTLSLPPVLGNFQELEQVVINLIENALQALKASSGIVTVSTAQAGSGAVEIRVSDNGVGIPRENLERISDPFFTTKRESGGTGLGLSLASSIITDHGGQLKFASAPGSGTTAMVFLPSGPV